MAKMARDIKVAVVGVGYLGRFHAQKYQALPGCVLAGVIDTDPARAKEVGAELNVEAHTEPDALLASVDAVSIAVPTSQHYPVALQWLEAGRHVLVEKPIAPLLEEAQTLVELAEAKGVVMQVGYLERFNPAFLYCKDRITRPQFIEAIRIASFLERGSDVDVVLDLMTHDLDLVLALAPSPLKELHAVGKSLMTDSTDLANARLIFEDGCVANITASRISHKTERKLRVFQQDSYLSMDFSRPSARIYQRETTGDGAPTFKEEKQTLEKGDSLMVEIADFIGAIRDGRPPAVTGRDGLRAIQVADRVMRDIAANRLP